MQSLQHYKLHYILLFAYLQQQNLVSVCFPVLRFLPCVCSFLFVEHQLAEINQIKELTDLAGSQGSNGNALITYLFNFTVVIETSKLSNKIICNSTCVIIYLYLCLYV